MYAKGDAQEILASFVDKAKQIQSETLKATTTKLAVQQAAHVMDEADDDDDVVDISRGTWSK